MPRSGTELPPQHDQSPYQATGLGAGYVSTPERSMTVRLGSGYWHTLKSWRTGPRSLKGSSEEPHATVNCLL